MGRYIAIGIRYKAQLQVQLDDKMISDLKKRFPEELFDYESLSEKHCLSLKDDISPSSIADIRVKVLSLCNLPFDKKEVELNGRLHNAASIMELENIAQEPGHCSFSYHERPIILTLNGKDVRAEYHYFMIYCSSCKFLPEEGYSFHEITDKTQSLIYLAINEPIVDTVKVFIDG